MEIFGLHKREFFLHLDFIKRYHNIDSANIYTTLLAPFSPTRWLQIREAMKNTQNAKFYTMQQRGERIYEKDERRGCCGKIRQTSENKAKFHRAHN
jgi:hypothetical protein